MEDKHVNVEATYGCKVFRLKLNQFKDWCDGLKATMTSRHAEDLTWAYQRTVRDSLAKT